MNCNNSNNNNNNNHGDGIKEILEKIAEIQKRAVREEIQEKFCDFDFLEDEERNEEANTRPIQVFTDDDEPWHCPIERDEDGCNDRDHDRSCVFRVERVEDGIVTLRALEEKEHCKDEHENHGRKHRREKFKATDSFITIKIANIAAIRCLKDTFVDICLRNRV